MNLYSQIPKLVLYVHFALLLPFILLSSYWFCIVEYLNIICICVTNLKFEPHEVVGIHVNSFKQLNVWESLIDSPGKQKP